MFDPSLPQENTPVDAVQMRAQLNGLKDLIDAVPVIAAAQVEAVNTVPTGTSANATVSVVGDELRFTFDIPKALKALPAVMAAKGHPDSRLPMPWWMR